MIKLLILILLGFVGYSMVTNLLRPKRGKDPRKHNDEGETMVEDPQCNTFLPLSDAYKASINGRTYYFCSKKCRTEFKQNQNP